MKLEVGQTVYLEAHNNAVYGEKKITPVTIIRVAKKWAYTSLVRCGKNTRFNIESGWHDGGKYSPDFKLWTNLEELETKIESEKLNNKFGQLFYMRQSDLTLDQLRRIDAIVSGKDVSFDKVC